MKFKTAIFLGTLAGLSIPGYATESAKPSLTLEAQAAQEVAYDEMVATLVVEHTGASAGALNRAVLKDLNWALAEAKQYPTVSANLHSIQTHPRWANGKTEGWTVRGEILLTSAQLDDIGTLAAQLGAKLQLASVDFRLSAKKTKAVSDGLITEVAQQFKNKASALTLSLGYLSYEVKDLNYRDATTEAPSRPFVQRSTKMMAMEMSDAIPVPSSGGKTTLSVTLQGQVILIK